MIRKALLKNYRDEEWALYNYNHMCNCSCYMCGNPRHSPWSEHKLTMQELRAKDDYKDQIDETIR